MYSLEAQGLGKRFGVRKVFSDISFKIDQGDSLAIVGHNGSGKSTLLMLLLGQYHPSKGSYNYLNNAEALSEDDVRNQTALISPYLNLYDHLSAEENLVFFATVAGGNITGKQINSLLSRVGLEGRGDDLVGTYSSGMKQRLKYAAALSSEPTFLFLDEPTSNLDDSGKEMVHEIVEEYREKAVIIIATNEKEEYSLARQICRLGE